MGWLKNIIFPKRCAFCGEILPTLSKTLNDERVLCGVCRAKWEAEKSSHCKTCGKRYADCRCACDLLFYNGVRIHLKLARYRSASRDCVANKMIHRLKRKNDAYLFDFAAEQLGRPFLRYVIEKDIDAADIAVTFVPRNRTSVARYGYDHAEQLALRIAASVSLEAKPYIQRTGRSIEQKSLSRAERIKNVSGAFVLAKDADVRGKTVFVVDDVITSGASMAECAHVLFEAGAADVVAVSLAATK